MGCGGRAAREDGFAQYKHVVLGLIFLKYVSDTFMVRHRELARLVDDPESDYFMPNNAAKLSILEDRDEYTAEGVFWIPEGHRWDDLRKAAKPSDIGKRVDEAMEAIERENPTLKGVLPKNYTQRELSPENIGGLIDTFSRQDLAAEEYKGLDVLGRVYEYFLGQFASNEGKKAGEFYTPRSVVVLGMVALALFAFLDANYLRQEKAYRALYVTVANKRRPVPPFTLDPTEADDPAPAGAPAPRKVIAAIERWVPGRSVWLSWSIAPFYCSLLLVGLIIAATS